MTSPAGDEHVPDRAGLPPAGEVFMNPVRGTVKVGAYVKEAVVIRGWWVSCDALHAARSGA